MKFEQQDILNGQRNEQKQRENPNSFGELNGSAVVNPDGQMKSKSRMAGQQGQRAMEMMNNPEEQERTASWMKMFGLSNQGAEWNQAKMGLPPQA
jgi:hypothetical protein